MQLLWLSLPVACPLATLPFLLTSRTMLFFRIITCPMNDHNDSAIFPALVNET